MGVSRQYCGTVAKVANCQIGVYLAYLSPRGHALGDRRLWLPREWTADGPRCDAAQVPAPCQTSQKKTVLALALLQQARAWGHLQADWVTGDDAYGPEPDFRDGVAAADWRSVLEGPSSTPVWPVEPTWETPPARGRGPQPQPRLVKSERQEARARAAALPPSAWQVVTVGNGAQGPRPALFGFERIWEPQYGKPGREGWLIHKQSLAGTEPRTFLSNAPADTPVAVLARVALSRWPIETEFQHGQGQVALDQYEVRGWRGWHHHQTLSLLAAAFLLTLQQEWEKKLPQITRPQVYRLVYEHLPRRRWEGATWWEWVRRTQARNEQEKECHARRRAREQWWRWLCLVKFVLPQLNPSL